MTYDEIKEKYLKNEKIIWQGKPVRVPLLNKSDFLLIPLSLAFGVLLISYSLFSLIAMIAGHGIMFSLIGITFLLIGFYIIFGRLWYRRKNIKSRLYFVTDKRVFCFDTMRNNVTFDILLPDIDLTYDEKGLYFSNGNIVSDFIYNMGIDVFFRKYAKESPAFIYIDNLKEVAKLIIKNTPKEEDENNDDSLFI